LVVGRHVECDVQILSPKISRLHCCIARSGECLVVRDLNSTNGIRVNGVRVIEGRLGAGDELAIGTHRYRVQGEGLAAKAVSDRPNHQPAGKRKARAAAKKDLESCEEPVALAEPALPLANKEKKLPQVEPVPMPEEASVGPTEPPLVEPLVEMPRPVLEVHPGPLPPRLDDLGLISSSDQVQDPRSPPTS
jgi:predicted component of type VI protein secretion system